MPPPLHLRRDTQDGRWRVRIYHTGRQRHVGRFTDETAAARAYDRAVVLLHGIQGLNSRMAPTK